PPIHLTYASSPHSQLSSYLVFMSGSSSAADPWLNPFPTGKGWVAMLLGSVRGDQDLFLDYMKVAMRYTSVQRLVDAANEVRKKTTSEEKHHMCNASNTPTGGRYSWRDLDWLHT
ncbi:hypothetical protein ZWY2020_032005, partial [Hordeum vulgare]